MAFGRRADDVQLIEAAEAREEAAEGLDHAAVARQQRQDVGVERQTPRALDRDDQAERHDRHDDRPLAMRPLDDGSNQVSHESNGVLRFWSLA